MQREHAPALFRRVLGLALLALGLLFLSTGVWVRWFGLVPEAGLTFVTGPAREAQVERGHRTGAHLSFFVREQRVAYNSSLIGYRQLAAAAQAGATITVGYGPVRLPFGLRAHATTLYTISIGSRAIRTYADHVAEEQDASMSAIVFGSALLLTAFFLLRRRRRR